jgi:hypothetical protein
MDLAVSGVVRGGVVVPDSPLPEGAQVEILIRNSINDVPPDLQAELDAWDRASANALELVERLAQEKTEDEKR